MIKNKLKESQELSNLICESEKINPIEIQIKNTNCGRARVRTRKITIPLWIYKNSIEFVWYYVIHEVCHFIMYDNNMPKAGHNEVFKAKEKIILKDYGMIPIYARAYPKELKTLNGLSLYTKKTQKE